MKKLLLTTSVFLMVVAACQSHPKPGSNTTNNSASSGNTNKDNNQNSGNQSATMGTVTNMESVKKDTVAKSGPNRSIIHTDPNQAQIDSVKKAKTKSKNEK